MATEIERKFLLVSEDWRGLVRDASLFRQGYLSNTPRASVRVRIAGSDATLNIKGMTVGLQRSEHEYPLPLADAVELLERLCERPLIEKTRHLLTYGGKRWEIDEFHGDNAGLIVAEVELDSPEEAIELPGWVGRDVSHEERYYNVCLIHYPYNQWSAEERR